MAFKVRLFEATPDFEALQAAKMISFPYDARGYQPYSQARVCFSPQGLHVQLLSFETESSPNSQLAAVFHFPGSQKVFHFSLCADGSFQAVADAAPLTEVQLQPIAGEDLQGVYWGGVFTLPAAQYAAFSVVNGAEFTGNFYKICEGEARAHRASFYPADFTKPLTAAENRGAFAVINY